MRSLCLFVSLTAFTASFAAAGPVVGSNDSGNCYPFSCFAYDGGTVYQEVYSSSAFSGPISISSLTFYQSQGGGMDDANYTIDLSTTSSNIGDGYPLVVGADDQLFGTFHISGNMPASLTLTGTPFSYNPLNGNLLMQVTVGTVNSVNPCGAGYCSFFEADYTGAVVSRAYTGNIYGVGGGQGALVTGFNVSSTPEPATLGLFGSGLAAIAALRRRRK